MRLSEFLIDVGRPVAFYPAIAEWVGLAEAVLLCQLIYWSDKTEDGWIYKTADELKRETSLDYKAQWRARNSLRRLGLVEDRYARLEHVVYFKVNFDRLNAQWDRQVKRNTPEEHIPKGKMAISQNGRCHLPKRKIDYVETTSETTTKTTLSSCATKSQGLRPLTPPGVSPLDPTGHAAASPPKTGHAEDKSSQSLTRLLEEAYQKMQGRKVNWTSQGQEMLFKYFQENPEIAQMRAFEVIVSSWQMALWQARPVKGKTDKYYYCRQLQNVNHIFRLHPTNGTIMLEGAAQELDMDLNFLPKNAWANAKAIIEAPQ